MNNQIQKTLSGLLHFVRNDNFVFSFDHLDFSTQGLIFAFLICIFYILFFIFDFY